MNNSLSASPETQDTARSWFTLFVLTFITILAFTDRQVLSVLVDPIRTDLGISETQIALLQGMSFAVIYGAASLFMGKVADAYSRRNTLLAGLCLWVAATVAAGYAHSFHAMFITRLFVGLGESALVPASVSIITDIFPRSRRGLATAIFFAGLSIGGATAIAFGGAIFQLAVGGAFVNLPVLGSLVPWRQTLVSLAVPGLIGILLTVFIREPVRSERARLKRHSETPGTSMSRRNFKSVVAICAAMSFTAVVEYNLQSWTPTLLARNFRWNPGQIAEYFGVPAIVAAALAAVLSGFFGDWQARLHGRRARITIAATAAIVGIAGAALLVRGSGALVVLLSCAALTAAAVSVSSGTTAVQETVPESHRAFAVSCVSFGSVIGGLGIGTMFTALLTERVFKDPMAIAISMSMVVGPAAIVAATLYWYGRSLNENTGE